MKKEITVNTYFNDIDYEIKKILRGAKERIWICVAWISFRSYQDLLLKKINEGVEVHILCNGDTINYKNLSGIVNYQLLNKVHLLRNPISTALIHHKFCIIDDSTIITGSFNWSNAAFYHYENIVVIKNDYVAVNKFKHEFCDLLYMAQQANNGITFPKVRKSTSTFILGMISESHGIYENVILQQWEVDLKSRTCERLHSIEVQHFYNQISTGLDDFDDDGFDYKSSKEYYMEAFNRIRKQIIEIQDFFNFKNVNVHAVGRAIKTMESKYDDEEASIAIVWKDVRYRKIVPDNIYVDGDFEMVFDESYYAGN
ncbi:phospholipase D-like domain-containing protein [Enterobacter pseudoroggenkampii]|uniref:phospholipase D n=1 Tax=Enterobacter pseudoroggenkampii TaxID=2996112 RepID=A0ABT3XC25_9ENTR|nr:phospholipase D-like domain-containing protein [Enterobacter pseudoroggenkampii]MCX8302151.1 phospholipase D-like domain-containing protein [Enterobacter pseudoroggenkampii]